MVQIRHERISGDGVVYPCESDGIRFEILVSMNPNGDGWRVRFDIGGNQVTGNGATPNEAFRVGADLTRSSLSSRGMRLDIEAIESALAERNALDTELKIPLQLSHLAALGIRHEYPKPVEPGYVESVFRGDGFVARTQGIHPPHWRVVDTVWKDFGRELVVVVQLGR